MSLKLNLDTSRSLDLEMVEGIDYSLECTVTDDETGAIVDLTGMTINIQFREDINSAAADISFVSLTDITIASNVFTWNITNAKTATKGGKSYNYGIQVTDLSSLKHYYVKGVATITEKAIA